MRRTLIVCDWCHEERLLGEHRGWLHIEPTTIHNFHENGRYDPDAALMEFGGDFCGYDCLDRALVDASKKLRESAHV